MTNTVDFNTVRFLPNGEGPPLPKIVPLFYHIYHPQTRELKGCLLGSCHELRLMGLTFADSPEIFGENSRIQKCFEAAPIFAGEIDIQEELSLQENHPIDLQTMRATLDHFQSMDASFEIAAREMGKKVISLETEEEYQHREALRKEDQIPAPKQEKCFTDLSLAFRTGSEELLSLLSLECGSVAMREIHILRNQNMAARAEALLHQRGPVFFVVGAVHVAGEKSVCHLLRERGWIVQRVI